MKFSEIVKQAVTLLHESQRITYRALKLEFDLNEEQLAALKEELIEAREVAVDKDGKMLVWAGEDSLESRVRSPASEQQKEAFTGQTLDPRRQTLDLAAERRQLTVMFCDLVGSTALSAQLDPEDYRGVVQRYHQTCAAILQRHEGHLAQPLGDGLLVYFGHPRAHEDDARRAVRAGLEIVAAMRGQEGETKTQSYPHVLQVRIGIHTGLVVIGEIGAHGRTEHLALGETPNIAARLQGLAEPNTVLISAATQRLLAEQFECQPFGSHLLKGIATPLAVYHVQSERLHVSPLAGKATLIPLVGREQEVGLLLDRWQQVQEGRGQVVLLNGEPGIGKSRLAQTVKEHVTAEGSLFYEARCSPYHQQSALYPLIDLWQRTLLFSRDDSPQAKVAKLEQAVALYGLQDTVPLLTALLSLPTPAQYPPLTLTPQKQKERTLDALLQLLLVQAERQATVVVWEDVHWADPSSLEFLALLIEQLATTKLLLMLTFRPEFVPPWKPRSHMSHLVLNRLGQTQVEAMIVQAAAGKVLSPEVREQIRLKTDGVPLFVEELTKSIVEAAVTSVSSRDVAIPATLQDALMARLDRLAEARQIAQLGATVGREFSYELIQAVAAIREADLHAALEKLVDAEILYQRGTGEQARYVFKHALIQDTAYQSLLKSTRQQYHQQIAQVLEEQFPETKATQPELLAHHYTEAKLIEQAIPYWQQAGEHASQRSAYVEALDHFSKGLELLKTLPDTPTRTPQEIPLQLALGSALMAIKGVVPQMEAAYTRALGLCRQTGEMAPLFSALAGLRVYHITRGEYQSACELGEQLLRLAHEAQDPALLADAHLALGAPLSILGELAAAREHIEQGITLYALRQQRTATVYAGLDMRVVALPYLAQVLWLLGYPQQARERMREALTQVQDTPLSFSTAIAELLMVEIHQFLREVQVVQERAEVLRRLCVESGFSSGLGVPVVQYGWALAILGQEEAGVEMMQEGIADLQVRGTVARRPYHLALLAEVYSKAGQVEAGLTAVAEALELAQNSGGHFYVAELYRLKGELTLQQESKEPGAESPEQEAEAYFQQAIAIAQQQQAKSWELRASTSLARLWERQGKRQEAHEMLSTVYHWFTEGFDTKDLQEAKTLLAELQSAVRKDEEV